MHDSRKTFLNVLLENLLNFFNIITVGLLIIFVINKSYIYLIPLALSICASIISFILNLKHYVLTSKIDQRINVLINGNEQEKAFSNIKTGEDVVLYPGDRVNFVGKVKSGIFFVDDSSINGTTRLVKKSAGSFVIKGEVVVEGSGVVEVTELERRFAKVTPIQETRLNKRINSLNIIFSSIAFLVVLITFIFDKEKLDNVLKCALLALPCLLNILLTVYLLVKRKKVNEGIEIFDYSFLSELQDVDVVCLDKTGTLTTGEFDVFKTVILSQTSFSTIAVDPNRAFEQVVSNIIKTTKEKGSYFSSLQKHFVYDVSKIIDESSPLHKNGLYSAITVKGGNTYAIGEADNFELANLESASSIISEYEASGYRVLVLVESKNPLKSGLIDGKSTAIGLIVLQETIRESAKQLIEYCLNNGKQIKVISGDRIAAVSEISRKAGLENLNKATSIKLVPFEKLSLLLEEDVVFADATPSQKAFIVKELQKNGHKVAFIGNGDNDTQAMKTANVAISISGSSPSAIKCSHACVSSSFTLTPSFLKESKRFKGKMDAVTAIAYSQTAFASVYLVVFLIASFINKAIYNPFGYNHLMMWSLFGVLIPSIVLLAEKSDEFKQKCFFRNIIANIALLVVPIGVMYILQLLQYKGVGYFGLPSDLNDVHETLITSNVVNNLSYLSLLVMSLVIAYNHFSSFNKYRTVSFLCIILIPVIYAILLGFSVDGVSIITQIDSKELNPINYFVMCIITLGCSALYLLVLDIIATMKGENSDVKSKSRN